MTIQNTKSTILDQDQFKSFIDGELTVKESKALMPKIEARFKYILDQINAFTSREMEWFDFSNSTESKDGSFDVDAYSSYTHYIGNFSFNTEETRLTKYDKKFPTSWFYQSFENKLKKEVLDIELEKINKLDESISPVQNTIKNKMTSIQESIKEKLSTEEFAYIKFATPEEVIENQQSLKKESHEAGKIISNLKKLGTELSMEYGKHVLTKNPLNIAEWLIKNRSTIGEIYQDVASTIKENSKSNKNTNQEASTPDDSDEITPTIKRNKRR